MFNNLFLLTPHIDIDFNFYKQQALNLKEHMKYPKKAAKPQLVFRATKNN